MDQLFSHPVQAEQVTADDDRSQAPVENPKFSDDGR